jgi:DNA-binding transcriptional MocR family regulator
MSNTLWSPNLSAEDGPIYRAIADALERDLRKGILRDGARLPTHRELARRLGITPLTVTRGYQEAARRGLVDSTVGRGTYVRTTDPSPVKHVREESAFVDLSKNIVAGSENLTLEPQILRHLQEVVKDGEYQATEGMMRHRIAAAAWIKVSGFEARAEQIVITPGAQQAIVAILASCCRPGDVVLAEEWSYPRLGAIAGLLRIELQPVATDGSGLVPRSLEKAIRRSSPKALYTIPNFQNPTGSVMPLERRQEIGAVIRKHALPVIEDDVYGFLLASPPPPLASLAPELVTFLTSTSKSVTPSLRLGFAALPDSMVDGVTAAFGAMTAFTSSAAAEIFTGLLESGAVSRVVEAKRVIIGNNRRAAERGLGALSVAAHPMSPHLWLMLPEGMEAHELADRARLRGIAVAPASSFAVGRSSRSSAVRLSIGSTDDPRQVESALRTLTSFIGDSRLGTTTVV